MARNLFIQSPPSPENENSKRRSFAIPNTEKEENILQKSPKNSQLHKNYQSPSKLSPINQHKTHSKSSKRYQEKSKSPSNYKKKKIDFTIRQGILKSDKFHQENFYFNRKEDPRQRKNFSVDTEIPKFRSKSDKKHIYKRLIATQNQNKIVFNTEKFNILHKIRSAPINLPRNLKNLQRSQQVLKEFTNDFALYCSELDYDSKGFLNYTKFCSLLQKLRFIRDSFKKPDEERELILKAWKILCGMDDNKVYIDTCYFFLLSVMNLNTKNVFKIPESSKNRSKRQVLSFNKLDSSKIHSEFYLFFQNRTVKKREKSVSSPESSISSSSKSISEEENIEKNEFPSNLLPEIQDKPDDLPSSSNQGRCIRRVSLTVRDITSTPSIFNKQHVFTSHKTGQSISNTPKDISFNGSESEDLISPNLLMGSPIHSELNGSFIQQIKVKMVSTIKSNDALQTSFIKKGPNDSVIYRNKASNENTSKSKNYAPESFENSRAGLDFTHDDIQENYESKKNDTSILKNKNFGVTIKESRQS